MHGITEYSKVRRLNEAVKWGLEINPVIGVRHQAVENLIAELHPKAERQSICPFDDFDADRLSDTCQEVHVIEGSGGRYRASQIGKCYNHIGQRDKAQPYLKHYLELAPNASDAAFIRAIIDTGK